MDLSASKKRKNDENGSAALASTQPSLTIEDAKKIISSFSLEQLQSIVANAILDPSSVLASVRAIADKDTTQRKLFIRGLGWETTNESLRSIFSSFGEIEEAVVICEKSTGKSKGFGFVTFRHVDGAILALKEPSKKIDDRMAITQLAAAGNTGAGPAVVGPAAVDASMRKIYVGNVPPEMSSDRLLQLFSSFGEIEEGPLGFNKQTGKFRGYALFVYKTVEAARAAIEEPMKMVDGNHMIVKLAIDGKKKPGMVENKVGDGGVAGFGIQNSMPGSMGNQYGAAAAGAAAAAGGGGGGGSGMGMYGFSSGGHHHLNSPLQSSMGLGLSGQAPNSIGGSMGMMPMTGMGGYSSGGGFGGPYGSSSQLSGIPSSGGYGGLGMGVGSSLYSRQPASAGMGSGGYSEGGPYSLSLGLSGQYHQAAGSPPGSRVPPGGGMYQSMPPYY